MTRKVALGSFVVTRCRSREAARIDYSLACTGRMASDWSGSTTPSVRGRNARAAGPSPRPPSIRPMQPDAGPCLPTSGGVDASCRQRMIHEDVKVASKLQEMKARTMAVARVERMWRRWPRLFARRNLRQGPSAGNLSC